MEAEKIEVQGLTDEALNEAAEKILIENDLGGYSVPNRDVEARMAVSEILLGVSQCLGA